MIEFLAAGWLALINPASFPDSEFLQAWRASSDFTITRTETPETISKVQIRCDSNSIWPTHPQQFTKEYQFAVWAPYDHGRLKPDSYACQRPNTTNRFCLMATYANVIVMSDLFNDECGNTYRGYWIVNYLKSDESMGTLLSKGRTVYPKPDAEFPGEFQTGDSYKLNENDFLFFSEITKTEFQQIEMSHKSAVKEGYIRSGLQWKRP